MAILLLVAIVGLVGMVYLVWHSIPRTRRSLTKDESINRRDRRFDYHAIHNGIELSELALSIDNGIV